MQHDQYCFVPLCLHSSAEHTERARFWTASHFISFFPTYCKKAGAQQWISKIRRDPGADFVINRKTKVCSEHFTTDDYSRKDTQAARHRRVLKKTAVPSLFPWNRDTVFQCTTHNSNKTDCTQLLETS